jgi:hypothetical protein
MGARESRSSQQEDDDETSSQDYYAILQVDENANADEIRVSLHSETVSYSAMTIGYI